MNEPLFQKVHRRFAPWISLAFAACLGGVSSPLHGQTDYDPRHVYISLDGSATSIKGHFVSSSSGQNVELDQDLNARSYDSGSGTFTFEFQLARFRMSSTLVAQSTESTFALKKDLRLDSTHFSRGTHVTAYSDFDRLDGFVTYLFVSRPEGWLGLDAGVKSLIYSFGVEGLGESTSNTLYLARQQAYSDCSSLTCCLGLSGALQRMDGRLFLQGSAHLGRHKSAHSADIAIQARYFFTQHLGLHLLLEKMSTGGQSSDLGFDIQTFAFNQETARLGIMARW